ncbi:hypothetical protein CONLIGDRAFT_512801 [Coniochaeta ligniaria NRRL 30616]|uniref:Zn(2)-C6 fungal-type domain-containing protein n=1 Tax=Coniochaeta ligniaria NRRL 30616 TaxID=1408157 RepID=A0A1J7J802_9PEZI|nr:hypothetical protein CONLIGDRAFT_512801 [Coniochaeta ligniaria NRRL 30616]
MERRGPSHSGPYGRACTGCFKAKCKCVARADGPGCQRCHSLNRACQPSDSVRRSTILKKQNANARIAELEKKLESVIERLEPRNPPDGDPQREHQPGRLAPAVNSRNVHASLSASAVENDPEESEDTDTDNDQDAGTVLWSPGQAGLDGPPTAAFAASDFASDAENETLLTTFRSRMLQHFPFVHLPSEVTAHQLRRDRPLLLRAIVCVASQKGKPTQSSELRRAMSEALLLQETDRIDLLLALLTYLSWGWDHSKLMSRLTMQAVSLACEMSNPTPQDMDAPMRALFIPDVDTDAPPSTSHFLEQQRAVLGCFVLSSAVSSYFNHVNALRWTPHMDEGLAALGANRECPTDAAFAVQVRLQLLGQKAVYIRQQQQTEQGYMQAPADTPLINALVSLMPLQGELEELKKSLPVSEPSRHLAHIAATELVINETRHAVNAMEPMIISHFSAMTASNTVGRGPSKAAERSWCLWQCVHAIKACADALLALSASDFAGISFVQWAQLARSIVVLNHLTTGLEDQAWNRADVRDVVDMPVLLDRVAGQLELAAQVAGEQEPEGAFTGHARRMREFCSDWRTSTAREHRTSEHLDARSRVYGGARAGGLANMPVIN